MTNYIPYTYQPSEPTPSSSSQTIISQQGNTPQNESPKSPLGFTTTMFHSNPSMRRRRTEPIFSFESGPTFSNTAQHYDLLGMDQTSSYQVQLHAKMDRGFFKADNDWTCYRRNYFQVSSSFDVIGATNSEIPCLLRHQDQLFQVDYFSIGITARVTNNDKKIELVQHTPKRDKGPQIIPEPRPLRAGGNLHLAPIGPNNTIVTFERLQFKTATANNGKRRAAQQYYEIIVDLYANSTVAPPICVATCHSAPLVVRGRSPGHYADSHTRFKKNEKEMASLPSSPLSELGPLSPYGAYNNSYSPFIPPTFQQPPNYTTSSAGGPVTTPYFENVPQMYNDKNDNNSYFVQYYMNQQDPYNQSHNEDTSSYSSSHDHS